MITTGAFLTSLAANVGAPLVVNFVKKHFGGSASDVTRLVIDQIAHRAGVKEDDLPSAPVDVVKAAIIETEKVLPEMLPALVEHQRLGNELMLAEMKPNKPWFAWAWRPFGMWLMLVMVAYYVVAVPILNVYLPQPLSLVASFQELVAVFITFSTLYMGGNTALRVLKK